MMKVSRYISLSVTTALLVVLFMSFSMAGTMCRYCRKPIQGKYITANGYAYHEGCYLKHVAPHCAACGKPLVGEYVVHDGKNYHEACYEQNVASRCALCNGIIEGQHLRDYWGDYYCASHRGKTPECDYCGRFLGDHNNKGGVAYEDGRHVCNLCLKSVINDEPKGRLLLEEVRKRLGEFGVDIPNDRITFQLADRRQIAKQFKRGVASKAGYVEHRFERLGNSVVNQEFTIYILRGMPKMHFVSTAAHELMHVWQYLNCPLDNDLALSEGSCNYASLIVLRSVGGKKADYIIESMRKSADPVYGEGFRRVDKLVIKRGQRAWLEHLRHNRDFPPGY